MRSPAHADMLTCILLPGPPQVRALVLASGPAALVRLVGRVCWAKGCSDVLDILQTPSLALQLGYGLLDMLVLALLPELKPAMRAARREAAAAARA
jgi:hypothetical protein